MLVLRRKEYESVVLADEVTLTVEEICGGDGQRIRGATVRLGFESPRYVCICRSELLDHRGNSHGKGPEPPRTGGTAKPARPRPGKVVEVSDALVRLRIQVPRKVPVCSSAARPVVLDSEERLDGATHSSEAVHHVTCSKEDRITICNNITIATLEVQRFVPS
jgi:sRNA-binding carbon storage regulator CsrA